MLSSSKAEVFMMLLIVLGTLLAIVLIGAIAIIVRMPKVVKIKRSELIHAYA